MSLWVVEEILPLVLGCVLLCRPAYFVISLPHPGHVLYQDYHNIPLTNLIKRLLTQTNVLFCTDESVAQQFNFCPILRYFMIRLTLLFFLSGSSRHAVEELKQDEDCQLLRQYSGALQGRFIRHQQVGIFILIYVISRHL